MGKVIPRVLLGLAALLLCGYIVFQIYSANSSKVGVETALSMEMEDTITVEGLALREETVLSFTGSGEISYAVEDGGHVPVDGTVAYVYNSAQEAHARSTAERLEREIKELKDIQNSTGKGVITVENIDKQIKERLLSVIGQADSGQYSALEESKEQLLNLLNRRQLITGKAENFNERISDLTAQLDSLSSKFSGEAQTITTTQAGFFFSEVDGYENLTDLSTLTSMTTEEIGNLIATQRSAGNGNAIGKVAEDSDWYYLCLLPEERVQTLTAGTTLVMQVPSLTTTEIPVTVLSISPAQNGQSAVVLRANTISADLSTFRKQPVTLRFRTISGLRVDTNAVHFVDGKMGVYILEGITAHFVTIEPVYTADTYMIVRSDGGAGTLELYDEIIVSGKELADGKVVQR